METISVSCNRCGAPLAVGAQTRFVTCQFCQCALEVKRTDSALFTEELARLSETTSRVAGSLEVIELQNELERLDREWTARIQPSPQTGRRRTARRSGQVNAFFALAFAIFFTIVCFGMAATMSSAEIGFFAIVPMGMGIFALAAGIKGIFRSKAAASARREYERQRAALVSRLETKRSA